MLLHLLQQWNLLTKLCLVNYLVSQNNNWLIAQEAPTTIQVVHGVQFMVRLSTMQHMLL